MAIRMTGLSSGLDTESIVGALMEAHKLKKTKVEGKKTKLEWKQSTWAKLNTKIYNFYKDFAGKLRFQTNYKTKKATSSNSNKVTATAASNATKGSYTVSVSKIASAQYVTSGKLEKYDSVDEDGNTVKKDVTGSTKLSELGFDADQITVTSKGKTVTLNVDQNTTVNDFVDSLKSAGLNASFDEKQQRFFINSTASGEENSFTITSGTASGDMKAAQQALKDLVDYDNLSADQQSKVRSVLSDLQNSTAEDKLEQAKKALTEIADSVASGKASNYYNDQLKEGYLSQYLTGSGDSAQITEAGKEAIKEAGLWNDTYVDSDLVAVAKDLAASKASADLQTEEYQDKIKDAVENGLSAGGVSIQGKSTRDAALENAITDYEGKVSGGVTEDASALSALGLGYVDGSEVKEGSDASGMVVLAASDSVVQVNGATLRSSSTTIEVNGLTLDLIDVTDEPVRITVADDNSAVYDSIKEFINEYNSLLAELNKYYYADSAKGYDVLTDDQKKEMSDEEIEKWESKIKDSLLRRDTTLNGLIETLRSSMTATTIKASNGKTYSLANLGITTGTDYKEYGLLHIKGDEDDTEFAEDTNVLMNLLNEDPDVVAEVLSGITTQLYNSLTKKMQSTALSSALTFYNDKEMNSQLSDYKKDIKKWEEKLKTLEDRYYNQFTAMEKALANMQSQQNALAGLFGGY